MFCAGANIQMLAGLVARPQGQLLQVHQRDPQRDRGRHRPVRPDVDRRGQRHGGRRRLRAGPRVRRDRPRRRPVLGRLAARSAAARRAPRHRRSHPPRRQAPCPPRPRRRVRHAGRRGARASRPSTGDSSTPIAPRSSFDDLVHARALARASESDRPADAAGVVLPPLRPEIEATSCATTTSSVAIDREPRRRPNHRPRPGSATAVDTRRVDRPPAPTAWLLAAARQLDDVVLHLRFNEPEVGTWVVRTEGDADDGDHRRGGALRATTGWPGRSGCTGPARSSASTSRPAR